MESTDVLVIGSGIAGLCAAIEAARTGATVTVASAGKTMSGSSFFPEPGAWGLSDPLTKTTNKTSSIPSRPLVAASPTRACPDVCPQHSPSN